jgi:rod shape-determining protein MreC
MRRKTSKAYLFLFFSLLALMSIPKTATENLQGTTVAMLAPTWQNLLAVKNSFFAHNQNNQPAASFEETEKLLLENTLLRQEIVQLKDIMQQELRLINHMNAILEEEEAGISTKTLKARYRQGLKKLLQMNLEAIPAKVIFRSPDSWNSSFWINVGTAANEAIGSPIVAKNSPVLFGTSVIGVIDYAGKHQSRVRLITDSGLTPSIRAARGSVLGNVLDEKINALVQLLKRTPATILPSEQQQELVSHLESAAGRLSHGDKTHFLAKGELSGSSKPLWRSQRHQLKGIGFNYDFADDEGPARDLRTGALFSQDSREPSMSIVQAGDTLVTTGMDGVFPEGLLIAEVTHVHPLKEGDYYYELEAVPIAGNFDDLSVVFVIPPVNFDPNDQPTAYGLK